MVQTNQFWRFEGQFFYLTTRLGYRAKEVIVKRTEIVFKHPRNALRASKGYASIRN